MLWICEAGKKDKKSKKDKKASKAMKEKVATNDEPNVPETTEDSVTTSRQGPTLDVHVQVPPQDDVRVENAQHEAHFSNGVSPPSHHPYSLGRSFETPMSQRWADIV